MNKRTRDNYKHASIFIIVVSIIASFTFNCNFSFLNHFKFAFNCNFRIVILAFEPFYSVFNLVMRI